VAAYIIGVIDIHHLDNYKEYGARVPEVVEKFGGRYLVRGGEHEMLEEGAPGSRFVVIEFPDRAAIRRFYDSPEYQEIVGIRTGASSGFLAAVDGT
jgi:uncharacterized protein (DUF1330 family)